MAVPLADNYTSGKQLQDSRQGIRPQHAHNEPPDTFFPVPPYEEVGGTRLPRDSRQCHRAPWLSSPDGQGHGLGRAVHAEPELFAELAQDGGAEGDVDDLELVRHEDALPGEEGEAGAQSRSGRHQVKEGIDGSFVEQDRLQQREKCKRVRNLPFLQKVDLLSSQTINICKRQLLLLPG